MAGLVVVAVIVVFISGAIAGAILLVSLASLREDRRMLSRRAPDRIALAGRLVTGLRVKDSAGRRTNRNGSVRKPVTVPEPAEDEHAPGWS